MTDQWVWLHASRAGLTEGSYTSMRFDTFQETPENRVALTIAKQYTKGFEHTMARYPFILYYGIPGVGKSHLVTAIAWDLIEQGVDVRYFQAEELLDILRASYEGNSYDYRMKSIKGCGLLVVDDLGDHTVWGNTKLDMLIDHRYRRKAPLIVTTNDPSLISQRVLDRMKEGWVEMIGGNSWRGKRNVKADNSKRGK